MLRLVQPRSSFRTPLACTLCTTSSPVPTPPPAVGHAHQEELKEVLLLA